MTKHTYNLNIIYNILLITDIHVYIGPDICGPGTKKVHVIFSYKGKNLLINKEIRCKDDVYTHLYTLIVKPDNTYQVNIRRNIYRKIVMRVLSLWYRA